MTGYQYDQLERLSVETENGVATGYRYDDVGNRIERTGTGAAVYVYDGLNQLRSATGEGGGTFDYDAMGNMVSATSGGETVRYEYDLRYQLLRVSLADGSIVGQYEYDYAKRRIARKTGEYQVWNVYAGSEMVNEYATAYAGTNTLTSRNDVTWGAGEAVATSWRGYQFTDALGSVTQTATGEQIEYDAFGGIKTRSDAPDEQADTLTKIAASRVGYTGQFFDTETGLQPLGNGERYYNPKIGRFIQADSWLGDGMNPMSFNRYAYGYNNPQGYRDPSGNNPISEFLHEAKVGLGVLLGGDAYFEAEERRQAAIARGEDPANLPDSTALAISDFTGATSIFTAVTGSDPYTGRELTWTERVNEGIFGTLMLVGTALDVGAAVKAVAGAGRIARAEQKLVGALGRWAERLGEGGKVAQKLGAGIERVLSMGLH